MKQVYREFLFQNRDEQYRLFQQKHIKTSLEIVGVRIPRIREFFRLHKQELLESSYFVNNLPHLYFEEMMLAVYVLNETKQLPLETLSNFLSYVDNWSICDSIKLKFRQESLYPYLLQLLHDEKEFCVRYAIVTLLYFYINPNSTKAILAIQRNEYYIQMAKAWYLTEAIINDFNTNISYLNNQYLDKTTHSMTRRKCLDSFKLNQTQKEIIKNLKYEEQKNEMSYHE